MTRIKFHQNLDGLKERLLVMAGMAEQAIQRAIEAYTQRDARVGELVLRAEPAINRAERDIDQMALDLLAMEQPMAIDLRFILAVIKINADLERVGDQHAIALQQYPTVEVPVDIARIAGLASAMVRKALQSFIEADAEMAEQVILMDDEVDRLNEEAYVALTNLIRTEPSKSNQALTAILICRNIERVGDHATNIAEDVIFWVRGADVRHPMSQGRSRSEDAAAS
jgi:phosphate transport system protein